MAERIFVVDAFTDRPFAGNPAAVCVLSDGHDEGWMRAVAREMNLPATTFVTKLAESFDLRWFTPIVELDLCGHGTLASAHVLWDTGHLAPGASARFHTRSGLLVAERKDAWIDLDFPNEADAPVEPPPALEPALGATPRYVGKNRFDYVVEVESEEVVRGLHPDLGLLGTIPTRGVIVTSRAVSPEYDFMSRFFAPRAGIPEDAVTGSAHCCLGPFWQRRLRKSEFVAYQASARGGVVRVRVGPERVSLGGHAVTVLEAQLL